MRRVAWVVACVVGLGVLTGCVSQAKYDRLLDLNRVQGAKIKNMDRELAHAQIELDALRAQAGAHLGTREASERLVRAKEAQIASLQGQCDGLRERIGDLSAAIARRRPEEILSEAVKDALKELAANERSLEFDPGTGTCKFSSDIVFNTGDDTVRAEAAAVLKKFAAIFTGVGKDLHLRVEGHTDDRRIAKRQTKERHPTNWHLSAHRAISVVRVLYQAGIEQERMSAGGFGKWRPIVANTSAESRARNRRVEIYVITAPGEPGVETVATSEPTVMGGE